MPTDLPETPQPRNDGNLRVTDNFKPVHYSEPTKRSKREVEDEEGSRTIQKPSNYRHVSITTARFTVYSDTPKPQKTATSTRLSLGSDAALRDSPKSPWNAEPDTGEVKSVEVWSTPVDDDNDHETVNNENDEKTVDDESKEAVNADIESRNYRSLAPSSHVFGPKTLISFENEHEPINDGADDGQKSEEDGGDESHDNENKENIPPKPQCNTPSNLCLPLRLKSHHDQNGMATPSSLMPACPCCPSSLLVSSPTEHLPALPSSPSPTPLDQPNGPHSPSQTSTQ